MEKERFNNEPTNGGNLYLEDGILYKFFEDNRSFIDEKERNVLYFKNNPLFSPKIGITFYEGTEFLGFSQEFIPGCKTFKDAIGDESISYDNKVSAINGVFSKMRTLHENGVLVGDMHSRNIIFNASDGYIVDLDEVRFKGVDDFKFEELYQLKIDENSPHIKVANEYTDNVKATVSALSLLYGVDFEELIHDKILRVDELKDAIEAVISDGDFKAEVFRVLDSKDEVVYFDEVLAKQNTDKKSEVLS